MNKWLFVPRMKCCHCDEQQPRTTTPLLCVLCGGMLIDECPACHFELSHGLVYQAENIHLCGNPVEISTSDDIGELLDCEDLMATIE